MLEAKVIASWAFGAAFLMSICLVGYLIYAIWDSGINDRDDLTRAAKLVVTAAFGSILVSILLFLGAAALFSGWQ